MLEDAKRTAVDRNAANNAKLEDEGNRVINSEEEKKKGEEESEDDEVVGPSVPKAAEGQQDPKPGTSKSSERDSTAKNKNRERGEVNSEDEVEDEEDETLEKRIPKSHEVQLNHGSKAISAMAIDHSGSRLVTGSIDYEVKFWDFAGMDASLRSFRSIRPCESHVIKNLEYSATGDRILVVPGSSRAKVLDRDGHELFECLKGDPYVVDVRRNKVRTPFIIHFS
jgi:WD40 repeat protein